MMSKPAPAVKPTMTVIETKFTSAPSRARPSASLMSPIIRVRVSTSLMYSGENGVASEASEANTISEVALVGPDTRCHDEPQSAPTTAGSIAP